MRKSDKLSACDANRASLAGSAMKGWVGCESLRSGGGQGEGYSQRGCCVDEICSYAVGMQFKSRSIVWLSQDVC